MRVRILRNMVIYTLGALVFTPAQMLSIEEEKADSISDNVLITHVDDPHDEIHPGGLPTKKETEPKRAERERQENYPFGNHWPPGAEDPDRYKDKDKDKGNGDLTSSAASPLTKKIAARPPLSKN